MVFHQDSLVRCCRQCSVTSFGFYKGCVNFGSCTKDGQWPSGLRDEGLSTPWGFAIFGFPCGRGTTPPCCTFPPSLRVLHSHLEDLAFPLRLFAFLRLCPMERTFTIVNDRSHSQELHDCCQVLGGEWAHRFLLNVVSHSAAVQSHKCDIMWI